MEVPVPTRGRRNSDEELPALALLLVRTSLPGACSSTSPLGRDTIMKSPAAVLTCVRAYFHQICRSKAVRRPQRMKNDPLLLTFRISSHDTARHLCSNSRNQQ